jgi:apolipoprotein N-acyltransferase
VWAWGAPRGSSEHDQHLAQYVFRAVENRTPVVRAVNTGISASIDSNGRLVAVLQRDGVRSSVSGVMLLGGGGTRPQVVGGPRVLVDSRVAVYSTAGDVFAGSAAATGALLAGWLALGALAARKRGAA